MNSAQTGFLLVDKQSGPTSHDIVNKLRGITGIKKIGHAGTLDPFASGLMIAAVGRQATRQISKYVKMKKEYEAEIFLGQETDTYDRTGKMTKETDKKFFSLDKKRLIGILGEFEGDLWQIPPMFSAKKKNGKKLYELARAGQNIEREPVMISIDKIDLLFFSYPILKIKIKCGSGTYIRSLAYDIGRKIGSGAYLKELRRTAIGDFRVEKAVKIYDIKPDNWSEFLF
jgi:tRNA pseudouridine55 synthase